MRIFNNQIPAVAKVETMPFNGLGFAMDSVRDAAQGMEFTVHAHEDEMVLTMPMPELVAQPSGYSLLVGLGREIRGR